MKRILFNKALRILLVTNGLILLAGAMISPIYALFVKNIGGDLLDASLTGGLFALTAAITTFVAGKFADRKNDALIVSIGYACIGLGFLLYMFVNSIQFLFFIQILIGFGEAFYSPAFDALYSKHLKKKKEGREWGAWESMNYLSLAIGAFVGGIIANFFGFNTLFIIMSGISFISSLYMIRVHRINKKLLR